jgi:molybdopterin-guanine dinucleotide biosynthesis protein A
MPSAAILAGGRATRFAGRDKSTLVVDGRSILSRQIEELSRIADDIMIIGDGTTTPGPTERRTQHGDVVVRVVPDRVRDCGPLAGLDAAFAAARHDVLVVVACDMPFVTTAFLAHLLSLTVDADAVVPRTEDGYHPLCAAYTRACRPVVAERLARGRLSVVEMFDDVRVRVVPMSEINTFGGSRLLANVNTPAALKIAEETSALRSHEA